MSRHEAQSDRKGQQGEEEEGQDPQGVEAQETEAQPASLKLERGCAAEWGREEEAE